MRKFLLAATALTLMSACSPANKLEAPMVDASHKAYDLQAQYDKIAEVDLTGTDTSFLNDEQRQVVNLLTSMTNSARWLIC